MVETYKYKYRKTFEKAGLDTCKIYYHDIFPNYSYFYELDMPKGIDKKFQTSPLRPVGNNSLPLQPTGDAQSPGLVMKNGDVEFGINEILATGVINSGKEKRDQFW